MTDSHDSTVAVEEDDIDWEAHEEHVHPHEWFEAAALEKHTVPWLEAVPAEQTATLTRQTARILEPRTKNRTTSIVDCAQTSDAPRQWNPPRNPCLEAIVR